MTPVQQRAPLVGAFGSWDRLRSMVRRDVEPGQTRMRLLEVVDALDMGVDPNARLIEELQDVWEVRRSNWIGDGGDGVLLLVMSKAGFELD